MPQRLAEILLLNFQDVPRGTFHGSRCPEIGDQLKSRIIRNQTEFHISKIINSKKQSKELKRFKGTKKTIGWDKPANPIERISLLRLAFGPG